MSRYFKYFLLAIFLAAVLLIVFLQYNSNSSINKLIYSNENLLNGLTTRTDLQRVQTEILTLESKVRGTVIRGETPDSNHLLAEISSIRLSLKKIDTLNSDSTIQPMIAKLNNLVAAKIDFNKKVIDTFRLTGKAAAENIINTDYSRKLTDSIKNIIRRIDDLHQLTVTSLIEEADSNGRKARTLGTIMAIIAAIASLFTFGYVTYKIRQQQQLISRLNLSEKKARDAAQIKENFLANMSHEIRTPLNAILGFTSLLQKKQSDDEAKEYIQTLQRSGENLLAIVNDVLDLSKIEAGMLRIESAPFSIRGLIHSVEIMFREKALEKKLVLSSAVANDLPDILEGDATRLTQILVNLVGNAIKFTEKGSVSIHITNKGIRNNIAETCITITDTGIGIQPENLERIFERFQQAEDSVTRKYGGTGLGLAIVYELVTLQNGTVTATSKPGEGTSFVITIPYPVSGEQTAVIKNNAVLPATEQDFHQLRVLVVEDNEINQSLITHLFNNWKLPFDMVSNGKKALAILKEFQYDLILMDIQMPEMDGYTATREIRNTLKLSTPVIAMTAHAMTGEREKCISYGMNEYISKPIREDQLYTLINRFTQTNSSGIQQKAPDVINISPTYSYIRLDYMKEVSGGNTLYERTVTGQFIETIPEDLDILQDAWAKQDTTRLRQAAHNMRTTVSVMGLDAMLEPHLHALEYDTLSADSFQQHFSSLRHICVNALEEARHFLATLPS